MNRPAERLRTVRQIADKSGKPATAVHTEPVWITRPGVFSQPTAGNTIKGFTTGKAYFENLMAAMDAATTEVFIAGWQVNWDALMAQGVRLYDVVYRKAKRGIHFYVMPWDDANPVQTYETQTVIVLESINQRLKDEKVSKPGKVRAMAASTQSDRNAAYFSHHQKEVVIDGKIAFVGGIDLAYGRFDDAVFDLYSKAEGRWFLNSYNPGLPPMRKLQDKHMVDPDLMVGPRDRVAGDRAEQMERVKQGAYQFPYDKNTPLNNSPSFEGNKEIMVALSEAQPRQPWQDVHCRIDGPAAVHLARNFVKRWNSLDGSPSLRLPAVPAAGDFKEGTAIQVLRSAPLKLRKAEAKAEGLPTPLMCEDDIHGAMVQLISKAKRFLYIESQFFVSGFGESSVPLGQRNRLSPAAQMIKDGPGGIPQWKLGLARSAADGFDHAELDTNPVNKVCAALVERIRKAILDEDRPKFHAYITLPVHPEGSLMDGSVAAQIHYTMQTLSFGSQSLLVSIRRALKARERRDAGDANWQQTLGDADIGYDTIPVEDCFE